MDCSSYIFKYSQDFVFWTCFCVQRIQYFPTFQFFKTVPKDYQRSPNHNFNSLRWGSLFVYVWGDQKDPGSFRVLQNWRDSDSWGVWIKVRCAFFVFGCTSAIDMSQRSFRRWMGWGLGANINIPMCSPICLPFLQMPSLLNPQNSII